MSHHLLCRGGVYDFPVPDDSHLPVLVVQEAAAVPVAEGASRFFGETRAGEAFQFVVEAELLFRCDTEVRHFPAVEEEEKIRKEGHLGPFPHGDGGL